MSPSEKDPFLKEALAKETAQFVEFYHWIEEHLPPSFFKEVSHDDIMLITHSLMRLHLQDYSNHIILKNNAFSLCLDSPDADLIVLKRYQLYVIKKYRAFVSDAPPPLPGVTKNLRISVIYFTEVSKKKQVDQEITPERRQELLELSKERNPELTDEEFERMIEGMDHRFLMSFTKERLATALDLFFRASTRDPCQFEVRYNRDWEPGSIIPSLQIILAWRNVPKYNFLYRIAQTTHRHGLAMKKVNSAYVNPFSKNNILIMSLGLNGSNGGAAWEEADIADFLRELVTAKYFEEFSSIDALVDSGLVTGNLANFLRAAINFVYQGLVHVDINQYAIEHIEEALLRHPELTVMLCEAFECKFNPEKCDLKAFETIKEGFLSLVAKVDTGNELNDTRRKNVLIQAMNFIDFTLKTNFYRNNKTSLSFRLDPLYLDYLPFNRNEKFPELPYAIFFIYGMHFLGFHIRFRDLSRGGLRTVVPQQIEQMQAWKPNIFSECYNLAYTQQKKNKDIPEGGAKGILFLEPYEKLNSEADIYRKELELGGFFPEEIDELLKTFHIEQKTEYLYQAQRSYILSFLVLLNCEPDGTLKAKHIVDYWKRPEYIYLGPDENMHNVMIDWMASYSKYYGYQPGSSFITSKPKTGINHKEYGVTSLSVNVYMEEVLRYLNINPKEDTFTVKISGGPDGDVAGNQILNLHRLYPKTAKLLAITDVSGTIYDPEGLDLEILTDLFYNVKPIREYPAEKLSDEGLLLDLQQKRETSAYTQQTLCYRKQNGKLLEEWLSGNEMNHLHRHNLFNVKTDIFIPAGGRPRTLNDQNYTDYLDANGEPTSKAIVEGANLYLTPSARRSLEELGVIIIKDSSANKGGVTCSSLEVLCGLTLSDEEFIAEKEEIMPDILGIIRARAREEAQLILRTRDEKNAFCSEASEWISERINNFTDQLLEYLEDITLSDDPHDPLIRALLNYCPIHLRQKYAKRILAIPDIHKKAIIASFIASRIVYFRGLDWSPSIVDVLPLIASDPHIFGDH